jgi:uncharacterized protein YllA (UPF0747 family)
VFYVNETGRQAVRWADGRFHVGANEVAADELRAEVVAHPERFSPNVLLRPIVQDRLFPTIGYVAGPAELAYQAQLGAAYEHFGVPRPLLVPRAMATLLDGAAARFLERSALPLEALRSQDDSELNALLRRQLPPDLDAGLDDVDRLVDERRQALKTLAGAVDPTLESVVDTTIDRMHDAVKTLRAKVVQAAKRKDDTLRRQFQRAQHLTFPGGEPQERGLGAAFFVNRYGPAIGERLLEAIPAAAGRHYLLTL